MIKSNVGLTLLGMKLKLNTDDIIPKEQTIQYNSSHVSITFSNCTKTTTYMETANLSKKKQTKKLSNLVRRTLTRCLSHLRDAQGHVTSSLTFENWALWLDGGRDRILLWILINQRNFQRPFLTENKIVPTEYARFALQIPTSWYICEHTSCNNETASSVCPRCRTNTSQRCVFTIRTHRDTSVSPGRMKFNYLSRATICIYHVKMGH